jgi:hypothetical protein
MKISSILEDIKPSDVKLKISHHNTLNPVLWKKDNISSDIRDKVQDIVKTYITFLDIPNLKIQDILLVGSNVNYNWTSQSDIDVHILTDLDSLRKKHSDLIDKFLQAKRKIWNDSHDIHIRGIPVELYVQDVEEHLSSAGIFSIKQNKWISHPTIGDKHNYDRDLIKSKTAEIMSIIDELVDSECQNVDDITKVKEKIKKMRKSSLEQGGEYSIENLVFKTLRNNGYIEKLHKCYDESIDKSLSLDD